MHFFRSSSLLLLIFNFYIISLHFLQDNFKSRIVRGFKIFILKKWVYKWFLNRAIATAQSQRIFIFNYIQRNNFKKPGIYLSGSRVNREHQTMKLLLNGAVLLSTVFRFIFIRSKIFVDQATSIHVPNKAHIWRWKYDWEHL